MASSSSSYRPPKVYDVFINHRGPDTKETLATQLYNYLHNENCKVFLDYEELQLGDPISSSIAQAISSSSVQIAIFSPRHAESSWCLDELDLMLKSAESGSLFIPLFYHVEPNDLRYIHPRGKYQGAFFKFVERGRKRNDLERWEKALAVAADFSGRIIISEQIISNDLLKKILATIRDEVQRSKSLEVAEHPVGLTRIMTDFESDIKPKMQEKMKREEVSIVGIFGMGGRGKTTLAKQFFNSKRGEYKRSCFLFVKELCAEGKSSSLQAKLLQDLFGESYPGTIKSKSEWAADLKNRLSSCRSDRFLIVIDDVNENQQLESLLFKETLGSHSLVIVTTRDKGLLISAGITICYEVKEMKTHQGKKLFCRHAFDGRPRPDKGYKDLVSDFVKACEGLPLSLKILGSHVRGRDKHEWKLELDKAQKTPNSEIRETLKISYDVLDREQKQIFIDTACFFIGEERSMALNVWKASGWKTPEHGLQKLIEKCLVEVKVKDFKNVLDMHDHLRDLGRHFADEEMQNKSLARLWRPEHELPKSLKLIEDKMKEENCRWLQSIPWDKSNGPIIKFFAGSSIDCAPRSTDLLWLQIDLEGRCRDDIPSWVSMHNLQYLRVVNGHLKRLWANDIQPSSSSATQLPTGSGAQVPIQLKELLLERISLEEFSNSVGLLTQLEKIFLAYEVNEFSDCEILPGKPISETIRKLRKLKSLVLRGFPLSEELDLASGVDCLNELTDIDISFLKHIYMVKISGKLCSNLTNLKLLSMEKLGEVNLDSLESLESLIIKFCSKLERISGSFDQGDLVRLNIMGCPELKTLPNLENLSSLEEISLDRCGKLQEISGIETLEGLKCLYISTECAGIWKCIQRMEKLPSEITIAIGKAVDGAESDLNANLFADAVSPQAVREVHRSENGDVEPLLITPDSLSARVICALIEAHSEADFTTSITGTKPIAAGERILTFVFPRGTDRFNETFDPNWTPFHANVKKECIVSVWKGEEKKILGIFKTIISRLYKTEEDTPH